MNVHRVLIFACLFWNLRAVLAIKWPTFLLINAPSDVRPLNHAASDIRLVHLVKNGSSHSSKILLDKLDVGLVLGVDVEARLVFFVNGKEQLVVFPIDSPHEAKPTSVTLRDMPEALCVDWVTKKVYWSDMETNRIEFLSYANFLGLRFRRPGDSPIGSQLRDDLFVRRTVAHKNLTHIMGLCVDPLRGYLFYINFHFDAQTVERMHLDGSHRRVIYRSGGYANHVIALTVDVDRARLYASNGSIFSMDYHGGDQRTLIENSNSVASMSVYGEFLFWCNDTKVSGIFYAIIGSIGPTVATRLRLDERPDIFRIFEKSAQPQPDEKGFINPCSTLNDCSDLCVYVPENPFRTCVCPTGYNLLPDNRTCAKNIAKMLLFARRSDLRLISLDTEDFTDQTLISRPGSTRNSISVDFDYSGRYIYWSDSDLKAIKRAKLDGSDERDVISNEEDNVDGMAIDWVAGNFYWTKPEMNRIEVARLDGSVRRVVISQDLKHPRGIAVDPVHGYFYWSDWYENEPRIERAWLDGSNRQNFFPLPKHSRPNGLVLDIGGTKPDDRTFLYYADAGSDEIFRINADNVSDARLVYTSANSHAFGLTLLGDFLYWTDWKTRMIMKVEKFPSANNKATVIKDGLADLMGIKAIDLENPPSETNPCGHKNWGCSHFCFFLPIGPTCDCPSDMELTADLKTCVRPPGYLLYSARGNVNNVMRISMLSSISKPYSVLTDPLPNLLKIDFSWSARLLYYIVNKDDHIRHGLIEEVRLDGAPTPSHGVALVENGVALIDSLAVDWVAGNLYFSDVFYNAVYVATLAGRHRRAIIWGGVEPRSLAVHPASGHLFWCDESDFSIKRSDLSGGFIIQLLTYKQQRLQITALALDYEAHALYYIVNRRIEWLNLKTLKRHIIQNKEVRDPISIALFKDKLFWPDFYDNKIKACTGKPSCRSIDDLYENVSHLVDLIAVYPEKQISAANPCSGKTCPHLCLYSPSLAHSHRNPAQCSCASHFEVDPNGPNCIPPQSFLLFTQNCTVYRTRPVNLFSAAPVEPPVPLYFNKTVESTLSLSFDGKSALWLTLMEKEDKLVAQLHILPLLPQNGPEVYVKFPTYDSTDGVKGHPIKAAYDPFSASYFWIAKSSKSAIYVSKVLGQSVEFKGAIVNDPTLNLVDLAVDGERGMLYVVHESHPTAHMALFVKTGRQKKSTSTSIFSSIFACSMIGAHNWHPTKGAHCTEFRRDVMGHVNAITVDMVTGAVLFLTNPMQQTAPYSPGTTVYRIALGKEEKMRQFSKVYSYLSIYGEYLFLMRPNEFQNDDEFAGSIDFVDFEVEGILDEPQILHDAKIDDYSKLWPVQRKIYDEVLKSPCRESYCNRFCALSGKFPEKYECGCPITMALAFNNKTCEERKKCNQLQFACANGLQCIDGEKTCDDHRQCNDGSDELPSLCVECAATVGAPSSTRPHPSTSATSAFDAITGGKYPPTTPFRPDDWARIAALLGNKSVRCPNHRHLCLDSVRVFCDGKRDCPDGADESDELCTCQAALRLGCLSKNYATFSPCINADLFCNGKIDCVDQVDETNCKYLPNSVSAPFYHHNAFYILYICLIIAASIVLILVVLLLTFRYCNPMKYGDPSTSAPNFHQMRNLHLSGANPTANTTNVNINVTNNGLGANFSQLYVPVASTMQEQTSGNEPSTITTNIKLALYPPYENSVSGSSPVVSVYSPSTGFGGGLGAGPSNFRKTHHRRGCVPANNSPASSSSVSAATSNSSRHPAKSSSTSSGAVVATRRQRQIHDGRGLLPSAVKVVDGRASSARRHRFKDDADFEADELLHNHDGSKIAKRWPPSFKQRRHRRRFLANDALNFDLSVDDCASDVDQASINKKPPSLASSGVDENHGQHLPVNGAWGCVVADSTQKDCFLLI